MYIRSTNILRDLHFEICSMHILNDVVLHKDPLYILIHIYTYMYIYIYIYNIHIYICIYVYI